MVKLTVSITVDTVVYRRLEDERGDVSRSKFYERLLVLGLQKKKEQTETKTF